LKIIIKNYIFFLILLISFAIQAPAIASSSCHSISPASVLKPYKDVSSRWIVLNKLKKQFQNLPEKDKSILSKYIFGAVKGENTFLLINSYLRGDLYKYISKKDINKPLQMRLKMYSDQLSGAISKGRLPQNMLLYSEVEDKTFTTLFPDKTLLQIINAKISDENTNLIKTKLNDTKFKEKGFMLASYDKNFTQKTKIRFEIKAPKNIQAISIEDLNKQYQKQIIVNKGYEWKITDIKNMKDKHSDQDYYLITIKIVL